MGKDEAFLKRLLSTFKIEATEHVAAISSGLLELEKTRDQVRRAELIEIVFREAHSLKGAARAVNVSAVETVCRSMENIFSVLKKKDMKLAPDLFDLLHRALDLSGDLLGSLDTGGGAPDKALIKGLVLNLDRTARDLEEKAATTGPEPVVKPYQPEASINGPHPSGPPTEATIRVEKGKLDHLLLRAEGLLQAKQFAHERSSELREVIAAFEAMEKRWTAARNDTKAVGRSLKQGVGSAGRPGWAPRREASGVSGIGTRDRIRELLEGLPRWSGKRRATGAVRRDGRRPSRRHEADLHDALLDALRRPARNGPEPLWPNREKRPS